MKKSCKAVFSLVLMLLIVMSLSSTAFAASPSITFKGFTSGFDFQPGSEYTETDLFNSFKNVMPGDTVTETITFTNSASDCDFVNLYMRAEAHDETANPLSPKVADKETIAAMTEFLSKLSMKVWNGTELIYDAASNELGGLGSNKFLGTFRSGETATLKVELSVPNDLDNKFADRIGEVDWIFHVEAYNESQLSVRKVWSDGSANHTNDSITVNLLKDGKVEKTQVLNAENNWAYTFDRLAEGHTWTAEEAAVPAGYTVSYKTEGTETTITNTKNDTPPTPPTYPLDITVHKVWSNDNGKARPSSVTVTLYNGDIAYDRVRLSAAQQLDIYLERPECLRKLAGDRDQYSQGLCPVLQCLRQYRDRHQHPQPDSDRSAQLAYLGTRRCWTCPCCSRRCNAGEEKEAE